jgi:ABC-type Mn2+/Zn2+ transport system permease subunit
VVVISLVCGLLGLIAGMVLSVEWNWQPGPCVVLVMTAMFVLALAWSRLRSSRAFQPSAATP